MLNWALEHGFNECQDKDLITGESCSVHIAVFFLLT